jgi:hypothetical protein
MVNVCNGFFAILRNFHLQLSGFCFCNIQYVYYTINTVGLNEATIKKYIREQETHDKVIDKVSVKELDDPFRGS